MIKTTEIMGKKKNYTLELFKQKEVIYVLLALVVFLLVVALCA